MLMTCHLIGSRTSAPIKLAFLAMWHMQEYNTIYITEVLQCNNLCIAVTTSHGFSYHQQGFFQINKKRKQQSSLQWHHNGHNGISNHQPHDCLLNRLFRRRSKKTSKLRVTGLCERNSPVTGEFPAQRASNAENVSIWWCHHGNSKAGPILPFFCSVSQMPGAKDLDSP